MNTQQIISRSQFATALNKTVDQMPRCIIDCKLPSDVIFFLYEYEERLQIKLLVEHTGRKEDYVVFELHSDNRWVFTFQQLLQTLRKKYNPARYGGMRIETINEITELLGWLIAYVP